VIKEWVKVRKFKKSYAKICLQAMFNSTHNSFQVYASLRHYTATALYTSNMETE